LRGHNLVQVDLVVEEVVVVQTLERLQHFLHLAAHILDQRFIFDSEDVLVETGGLLRHSLLLLVHDRQKDLALIMLWLHFLSLEVDDLPQLIHTVAAC